MSPGTLVRYRVHDPEAARTSAAWDAARRGINPDLPGPVLELYRCDPAHELYEVLRMDVYGDAQIRCRTCEVVTYASPVWVEEVTRGPVPCRCDVWAGCTCGAMEVEQARRNRWRNPVTRMWEPAP